MDIQASSRRERDEAFVFDRTASAAHFVTVGNTIVVGMSLNRVMGVPRALESDACMRESPGDRLTNKIAQPPMSFHETLPDAKSLPSTSRVFA